MIAVASAAKMVLLFGSLLDSWRQVVSQIAWHWEWTHGHSCPHNVHRDLSQKCTLNTFCWYNTCSQLIGHINMTLHLLYSKCGTSYNLWIRCPVCNVLLWSYNGGYTSFPSGSFHRHWGNHLIVLVPVKQLKSMGKLIATKRITTKRVVILWV